MNKIIITTDLSKDKDIVIREGLIIAKKMQADVELLTIINQKLDFMPADIGMNFANQWEARKFIASKELQQVKDANPDLSIDVLVFIGDPQQAIIDRAIEIKASIIVIGTHGRTGLSHLLLGSTAEYVIRHSPIPVLVLPLNTYAH